jgi:DNA modification methylase
VITSPPYFGLRDYGTGEWEGGDPECDHIKSELRRGVNLAQSVHSTRGGAKKIAEVDSIQYGDTCGKCGAVRIDEQIGLEKTPEEYVEKLVRIFAEIKRVLRDDGTVWLNLGDSYSSHGGPRGSTKGPGLGGTRQAGGRGEPQHRRGTPAGYKRKDLLGIPWMVAFALRADGWYLRSEIIWEKPNCTPESVTDRPTKSHEYIFLLTKSQRYHYDDTAIREPDKGTDHPRTVLHKPEPSGGLAPPNTGIRKAEGRNGKGRNKRTVWTVSTVPFKGAHYACFPPKLIEPCVLAGAPPGSVILDPFAGTGVTIMVAVKHGRRALGIELGDTQLARERITSYLAICE